MKKISYFWEFGVLLDLKLWCHPPFFQVTACTLDFLPLLLMLLLLTAASPFFTIQGGISIHICNLLYLFIYLNDTLNYSGPVHLNLSYLFRSMLKLFIIHEFLLECDSACCLKLKNQVSAGIEAVLNFISTNDLLVVHW